MGCVISVMVHRKRFEYIYLSFMLRTGLRKSVVGIIPLEYCPISPRPCSAGCHYVTQHGVPHTGYEAHATEDSVAVHKGKMFAAIACYYRAS